MESGKYNSSLSAIIWIVQLLVFYDSALKEQRGCGKTLKLVKAYCDDCLQQTVETPMGEILRCRLLLFRVSGASISTHEASWDESEQVLTYENTELNFAQHRDNADVLKGADGAPLSNIKQSEQLCRVFLVENSQSSIGWAWRESTMAGHEATVQEFLKRILA
jgi:predicted amidophosphoribosyltransferase